MNIKFNYVSNRIKAGVGAFLLVGSLASCSNISYKNNNSSVDNSNVIVDVDNIEDVYVGVSSMRKDLNFTEEERKYYEDFSSNKKLTVRISDINSNDYITDVDVTIIDHNNNIVSEFVSDSNEFIINDYDFADGYIVALNNLPVEYGNKGSRFFNIKTGNSNVLDDKEYYNINHADIYLEKERDMYLNNSNEMLPGKIYVGACELYNGYIDGVSFAVSDESGDVIDKWISSDRVHCVYNLEDGKYCVSVLDVPSDYELSYINDDVSESDVLDSNSYNVIIKDGNYVDNNGNPYKSSSGPIFYFTSTKDKALEPNVKKLKK